MKKNDLIYYIVVAISLLICVYSLFHIGSARQEVIDYYEEYIDSHCHQAVIYTGHINETDMASFIRGDQAVP